MKKLKMSIALGILSTALQFWQPQQGHAAGEYYYSDNQGYYDNAYCPYQPFLNYIAFDGGYRWDFVDEVVKNINGPAIIPIGVLYENISSAQFGGKGAFSFNQFFVRGSGHYGIIFDGMADSRIAYSHVRGYTWDASGAVGYLFNCSNCLGIAPIVGYAYDKLHLTLSQTIAVLADGFASPNQFRGLKKDFRFYGPFVGVDFLFNGCSWAFDAGYELHIGHAKKRSYNVPTIPIQLLVPYNGRNRNMIGHVFRLDAMRTFCNCWSWGFGLKYTYWNNRTPSRDHFPPIGTVPNVRKTARLQWHSFAATINLGRTF